MKKQRLDDFTDWKLEEGSGEFLCRLLKITINSSIDACLEKSIKVCFSYSFRLR